MRFGMNLPGPFWVSFGGRGGRRRSGSALSAFLKFCLFLLPIGLCIEATQWAERHWWAWFLVVPIYPVAALVCIALLIVMLGAASDSSSTSVSEEAASVSRPGKSSAHSWE